MCVCMSLGQNIGIDRQRKILSMPVLCVRVLSLVGLTGVVCVFHHQIIMPHHYQRRIYISLTQLPSQADKANHLPSAPTRREKPLPSRTCTQGTTWWPMSMRRGLLRTWACPRPTCRFPPAPSPASSPRISMICDLSSRPAICG